MGGSTTLTTNELFKIATNWNISLDSLLKIPNTANTLHFQYAPYQLPENHYLEFLQELYYETAYSADSKLIYSSKIIPYSDSLYYPTLLYFNAFLFSRIINGPVIVSSRPFSLAFKGPVATNFEEKKKEAIEFAPHFFKVDSTETWHPGTIKEYLTRIHYCYE